jgi:NAD(P)-dependent dehydrogenase (short-subunit alcohol dehydrogenase family)
VCLLSGAGGRLGSAICASFAADYDVVAVFRNRHPQAASQLQWWIDPLHPDELPPVSLNRVFAVRADLAEPGQLRRVVDLALARFQRIDLVINAAVSYRFASLVNEQSLTEAAAELEVNTLLPVRLAARVAQTHWRHSADENRQRNRNVINVSSISAINTYAGQGMYSAGKAALNALTRHMAQDYATLGVRVNAIAPTSFPSLVPTASVVERIRALDAGDVSGSIVVLDSDGATTL